MHKLPPCAEYGRSLDGAHGLTDGTTSWMDSKGIEIRIKTTKKREKTYKLLTPKALLVNIFS